MVLPSHYSKSRLIKRFSSLGPYLREEQCTDDYFFFDCLAECISMKPAPDKREFFGWWVELRKQTDCFTYTYHFGLYDKEGKWRPEEIDNSKIKEKLATTLQEFYYRLHTLLLSLVLSLKLADNFSAPALQTPVSQKA